MVAKPCYIPTIHSPHRTACLKVALKLGISQLIEGRGNDKAYHGPAMRVACTSVVRSIEIYPTLLQGGLLVRTVVEHTLCRISLEANLGYTQAAKANVKEKRVLYGQSARR